MIRTVLLLALTASSCGLLGRTEYFEPEALLGCYVDRYNQLRITEESFIINGIKLPYEVQDRKVGTIVSVPAIFEGDDGILDPQNATEHFYRVKNEGLGLHIVIADQGAYIYRLFSDAC